MGRRDAMGCRDVMGCRDGHEGTVGHLHAGYAPSCPLPQLHIYLVAMSEGKSLASRDSSR